MRTTLIALLALAIPSVVAAQESADFAEDAPQVQMEQTTDAAESPAPDLDRVDRVDLEAERDADVENRTMTADDAAVQDPRSRNFWYIVLAVVVGGVILAVLL